MRISDWSSDVCSSDLLQNLDAIDVVEAERQHRGRDEIDIVDIDAGGRIVVHRIIIQADAANADIRDAVGHDILDLHIRRDGGEVDNRLGSGGFEIVAAQHRSEEHTSELQSLMRNSYAVFCLKKKINNM